MNHAQVSKKKTMNNKRNDTMKRLTYLTLGLMMAVAILAFAQQPDAAAPDDRSPPDNAGRGEAAALTAAQEQQVKEMLAKYAGQELTAEQARAIHAAFRQAGLRGGPAMYDAIKAAGVDPDALRDLAPPPGRDGGNAERPDAGGDDPAPDRPAPGDRQASGGGGGDRTGSQGQPPRHGQGQGRYTIEQAVSDRAQLNTIAFDGLAFLTGGFGCNTFLPPGKVADFCGFQYMRDVDTNQLGHNTSFVPRAANNLLYVLTSEQKAKLIALAREQEPMLKEFVQKRFPLIKAFCRQLDGDLPAGSAGLNRAAVMKYTASLYEIDGTLSYQRAEVLGGIVRSFTPQQRAALAKMSFNNSATWPELPDQVDKKSLSHMAHVAVMTYASEMFSWYAGNVEADVYFCPERHATYVGSFYMKDIPAMGNVGFSISTSLTGDSGEAFVAALTGPQRQLVTGLVVQQRADLAEIVRTRRAIATELRRFMKESAVDQAKVMALSRRYGELDGEISYFYATAFAQVAKTLTADQKQTLLKLRNLDPKFTCKGAYLYSRAIPLPDVPDTDFLFAAPGGAAITAPSASVPTAAAAAVATAALPAAAGNGGFSLRSSAVSDGGTLPKTYTGDGERATLPLEWSGAPAATKSFAVIMHHLDPEGKTKWYWTLYNIPATTQCLPRNVTGVGLLGNNSVNGRIGYAPPHSKGPGAKTYVYTVYALSAPLTLDVPPSAVNRDVLLAAMKECMLATAQLTVVYTRPAGATSPAKPEKKKAESGN